MELPYDAVLPRKLHELESRLIQIFHSPPPPITEGAAAAEAQEAAPTTPTSLSDDDMERRFEFLKNLLSAEMESHPGDKPEHLYHIADRLAFLEDAYHKWANSGTLPIEQTLDTVSVCSCTYSCFNEADDEEWMEPPNDEPPPAEAEPAEPIVPQSGEDDARANEENRPAHGKKAWTIGAVALLAAAAVGLVLTNLWVAEVEQKFLLVPT